jgi:hypothetical protein
MFSNHLVYAHADTKYENVIIRAQDEYVLLQLQTNSYPSMIMRILRHLEPHEQVELFSCQMLLPYHL